MNRPTKTLTGLILPTVWVTMVFTVFLMPGCDNGATSPTSTATGDVVTTSDDVVIMEFDVKGMSCEGCVFSVRSAIAGLEGVESCDVSLAEERATVGVRDAATERAIIEAVEKLDFTITRSGSQSTLNAPDAQDMIDG
jgi:copper chaperone CopZ